MEPEVEFCPGSGQWGSAVTDARYMGQVVCPVCGARVHRQAGGSLAKLDLQARSISHMRYKVAAS